MNTAASSGLVPPVPPLLRDALSLKGRVPALITERGILGDPVDVAKFPRIQEHFRRMSERPSVKVAVEESGAS